MKLTANDTLIQKLKEAIEQAGSLRSWSSENGFSATYVSFVVRGKSKISKRLASALGYRLVQGWEKMGC